MDLKEYYNQNIKKTDYHYLFNNFISNCDFEILKYDDKFYIYDVEDAIVRFKKLCQPEENFKHNCDKVLFYLLSFYLHNEGYVIEEFPRILARPPIEPYEFTYSDIRNRIISQGNDDNGAVRYATRRYFVDNLTFGRIKPHLSLNKGLEHVMIDILNHNTSFYEKSKDEQLSDIANVIEYLLKSDKGYIELDYANNRFPFISNESVKKLRTQLQCFRHTSEESIKERLSYTNEQKKALADYGVAVVNIIYMIKNKTNTFTET